MSITDDELEAIRERCDAATDGPWGYDDGHVFCQPLVEARFQWVRDKCAGKPVGEKPNIDDGECVADCDQRWPNFDADSIFIAAARTDVPRLLDEVQRLRDRVAELERGQPVCRDCYVRHMISGSAVTCSCGNTVIAAVGR